MRNLTNTHVLTVSYIGATNSRGSRVKIRSDRFKQTKIINYDHFYNNTGEIAQAWLESNGFELIAMGEAIDGYYLISNTFKPLTNS